MSDSEEENKPTQEELDAANQKALDQFQKNKEICEAEGTKCSRDDLMPEEVRYRIRSDGTKELIDPFGNIQETPIRPNIFPGGVVPCNIKG